MSENTARTIVIFSIVALMLGGFVIGGVSFIKTRNNSYASTQQTTPQVSTQSDTKPQQQTKDETRKNADSSKPAPAQSPSSNSNKTQSNPPPPPVPTSPHSTTPTSPSTDAVATTGPQGVPATGASVLDLWLTGVLMMLATFFGSKLLHARAMYRRYLS